jgi:hypothetical protein
VNSDAIISKTLKLLSDLCFGYSSLRRLVKSGQVKHIMENHTSVSDVDPNIRCRVDPNLIC